MTGTTEEAQPSSPSKPTSSSSPFPSSDANTEKWGTHVMGVPAAPTAHPNNQKAALLGSGDNHQLHHPYIQYSPVDKPSNNPIQYILHVLNSWGKKGKTLGHNIWLNLKTGPSVMDAAWGKVGLTAKAIKGGGFESLYQQTFRTEPNEKLKKTFACYMSTSTGPVAGTLYLSNFHIAFCSDRPLSFTGPSGQEVWCFFKVMIPLAMVNDVSPVTMRENPLERYIQINTIDNQDFWFMGFVYYEKASVHLTESGSGSTVLKKASPPVVKGEDFSY